MSNGSNLFVKQRPDQSRFVTGKRGVAGEVGDLRDDVEEELRPLAAISVDEFTNAAAAAAAGLEAATPTVTTARTVTSFLAGGVAALAAHPRNLTFTTAGGTPADAPATATITGTYRGKDQTEVVNVAQTAATATGLKPFSTVTKVEYSAGDGTAATVSIGFGAGLGTAQVPKSRAGLVAPTREIAIGAAVTTGVLTAAGLYTPSAAPNGTNDYAIYYEYDPEL